MPTSSTPRSYGGRSAESRQRERRERWLAAGLESFGTVGVRQTSLRALARASGVAERYFPENFTDLEDLFLAVHDRLHEQLVRDVTTAVTGAGPDQGRQLRAGLRALVDGILDDPRCARIKLVEDTVAGPRMEVRRQEALRETGRFLLGPGHRDVPPGLSAEAIGMGLAAGVYDLVTAWFLESLTMPREDLLEHCVLLCTAVRQGLSA